METLEMLRKCAGRRLCRYTIRNYTRRNGLLASRYMRKVAWRLMIQVMPREVARFIQSRFGELKISEARYEDLLSEADEYYPRYLEGLSKGILTDANLRRS
jgi:intergrase/recombinase